MSYQHKDTTYTKIFVGGLPYHTTDASLRDYFSVFGDIEEAVVITDRQTGKSRGYGFVTMSDHAGAERACKDANPVIDGRKANVNLAYIGAKPRVPQATLGLQQLPATCFTANQLSSMNLPTVLYGYPQQIATYATAPNGLVLAANRAAQPQPIIDYAGGFHATAQIPGAYATEVAAAAAATPTLMSAYASSIHQPGQALGVNTVAGTPQLIAGAPTQAGIPMAVSQALGSYHPAPVYAAVAPGQPQTIAAAPSAASAATYAQLTAQLQQQATDRY